MNAQTLGLALLLVGASISVAYADDSARPSGTQVARADAPMKHPSKMEMKNPGEYPVVLDDAILFPLWFEPATNLDYARQLYRQDQYGAAAAELRKAIAWLKFSEDESMPATRTEIQSAANDLDTVASKIEAGKFSATATMDAAIANTEKALAVEHFQRAKQLWGQNETRWAGEHLATAAKYLRNAAESANYEYGPDMVTVFDWVDRHGRTTEEDITTDSNVLGDHIRTVESELSKLANRLEQDSKKS